MDGLEGDSAWEVALAAEPGEQGCLAEGELDRALMAVADFADLVSPYFTNHARGVAALAAAAAKRCGMPEADVTAVRRAGWLHDLGRVGVPPGLWNHARALTASEWERVRLHPYYTERILARARMLAPLGMLAAAHHERLDGSGYHRCVPAAALSPSARLLAAADMYHALTEPRPHRPARASEAAAGTLRGEVRAGRLDEAAVTAVLAAAGHRIPAMRRQRVSDLTEREIEVLRLMARGLSNRQMAAHLGLAEKTVGNHVQHIYEKIGVSTRAAATLFAMQHNLLTDMA
jgi:HD-GYP domain-containing protein (c-di-GMP phosphodiesterase class II)